MKREPAWRVFAGEFNDSTFEIKGEGEMAPSYIITPLGAKINRLFVIGVLTDVENISEQGDMIRAHVSDPTGVFTIYSGEYQQDATDALLNIEVPAFVAVVGKTNAYTPEDGNMFVSIRPEKVLEVNSMTRDQWILETCKITKNRIEAVLEAMKMSDHSVNALKKLGYSKDLSEGIIEALKNYGEVDLEKYVALIQESLQFLKPEDSTPEKKEKTKDTTKPPTEEKKPEEKIKKETPQDKETDKDFEEIEKKVFENIKSLEGEEGASWDSITEKCTNEGINQDSIEEALNSLMDKGLIYEPILGTIKTT
jgi:uncharacterized protein